MRARLPIAVDVLVLGARSTSVQTAGASHHLTGDTGNSLIATARNSS